MKNLLMLSIFLAIALMFLPASAKAQYTTYTPTWNPHPDTTQMIIEKNIMRDRLRRTRGKSAGKKTVRHYSSRKNRTRHKSKRVSALENLIVPNLFIESDPPKRAVIA